MCGIAGELNTAGADGAVVRSMCDALHHRGPDEEGLLVAGTIGLGMRRLSIIDIAHSQQPVYNEDRSIALVFNGEIYNFQELRRDLLARGHRLSTEGDSEVIAHLYEDQGIECVQALRGMFAFALWDANRGRLVLARDRVGKKPLHYAVTPTGIAFASELKALLRHPAVDRDVDLDALDHYLSFQYVPAPWSILRGVRKLPPASVLVHEGGVTDVSTYWQLDRRTKTTLSRPEAVERTRELVREATRMRLISERPLGAFLSGGIDSSLVVAAMAEATTGPVRTFSIGFEDPRYDEREHARAVAQAFGTEHHELVVRPEPTTTMQAVADAYDEPFADSSAIPTLEVARVTRQHVTVALNGDGGDESFGGYTRYAYNAAVERMRVMQVLAPVLAGVGRRLPARGDSRSPLGLIRRASRLVDGDACDRYFRLMAYFDEAQKQDLYGDGPLSALPRGRSSALLRQLWESSAADNVIDRMLDVDVQSYLPGDLLVKVDIATMKHSLEGRSPLLDHVLMEFAASLPPEWKVHGRQTKVLLKDVARGWIPDVVIDRPKMGFGVPIASWLRTDLREPAYDLLTDATAQSRGWFDVAAVRRLLDEHQAGVDHAPRLWALLVLEQWQRTWIDPAVQRHPAGMDA
ncbi:MAG: hypothetical protein QOI82_1665 [Actinomycetota bacterium]|jgi:asparagine synthase (glutamine-hydrolysing)|nr:hypothetical protein [Actinomycetota bacterium]